MFRHRYHLSGRQHKALARGQALAIVVPRPSELDEADEPVLIAWARAHIADIDPKWVRHAKPITAESDPKWSLPACGTITERLGCLLSGGNDHIPAVTLRIAAIKIHISSVVTPESRLLWQWPVACEVEWVD